MNTASDPSRNGSIHLQESAKKTLERAASFEGKTVSQFILNSALAHAEKTIRKHEVMSLKASDAEAFFDALSNPVMFNKKLAAVLESHEQRVTGR